MHLVERPCVSDRFLQEVHAAAKMYHKNSFAAYSAMRLGASIVLAMECIDGEDLARMVKSRGPLQVVHASYFIYQATLGLQHAHECGMVHRDIKPASVIFVIEGKKGAVKFLDFGLAKVTSEGQAESGLTREGQMLGTPDYIATEQIRDAQSADIRADVYSLGRTLYYLPAGRRSSRTSFGTCIRPISRWTHARSTSSAPRSRSNWPPWPPRCWPRSRTDASRPPRRWPRR